MYFHRYSRDRLPNYKEKRITIWRRSVHAMRIYVGDRNGKTILHRTICIALHVSTKYYIIVFAIVGLIICGSLEIVVGLRWEKKKQCEETQIYLVDLKIVILCYIRVNTYFFSKCSDKFILFLNAILNILRIRTNKFNIINTM